MRKHISDVKRARKGLKKEASHLNSEIGKKISGALKQDRLVLSRMKSADRKKKN